MCCSPAMLALRVFRICLVIPFVLSSFSRTALAQQACTQNSRWTTLMQQGGNQHLPVAAREEAYGQARALCPQNPGAYEGLAVLLLQSQDYRAALDWIHQGLAIAPRDPNLVLDLGVALLSAGQPKAGLEALENLPPTAQGEFYLGMAYRALRDHPAAREAFAKSFVMGNNDPYVLYELIEQDRALHNEEQGLQDFQTFYQRFPHSPWIHLLLGNAYISRNNTAGAEAEYRKAAELNPKLPLVHYDLGRLAFNRSDYSQAVREFDAEIHVDPTFGEAYLYAGTSLRRLGRSPQGIPYLEKAIARDPNFPLAYRELAVAQVQAGQLHAASVTLREGESRFPHEPAFPAQLARLASQSGNGHEAARQSRLAETLSGQSNVQLGAPQSAAGNPPALLAAPEPDLKRLRKCILHEDARCAAQMLHALDQAKFANNADDLDLKAEALNLLHEDKEALPAVQRAIMLDPHRADFFITEGRIDQRLGNQPAAIRAFLTADRMQPGAEAPVYYLGMSFFMLGYDNNDNAYYDRAARHFKTALELNPRDDRAEFMLGVVDSIEFKLPEAQRCLAAVLKMKPGNPYYHLHYGMLLSHTGHLAAARSEMKLAETLDPSYASTYLRLGDLDAQMGQYAEARTQLKTAVRLDPHLASAFYTLGRVDSHLGLKAESRRALQSFQQAKAEEQRETDPIGASINAVASRP
jgi:tetratricopeptide (TPR) repeat protein